jgi:exodeoxyribonuclease III
LKIATFNINNINKRLQNLTAWLAIAQPDVVCLQELKAEQRAFPASALRDLGYRGVWLGERSWNGVAILARDCDPVLTRSSLPGNPADRQARYIEAAVNGVLITSIYLPNGNPQPGPKFDYKLAWFERLIEHGAELMKAGVPVVLAGDYNVVPTVQDIYPTRSLDKNALIQPQSRQAGSGANSNGSLIRSTLPFQLTMICLSSQGSLPDFRHGCCPAAQLAEFELALLDLLCQLDATDHDRCRLEALQSQHRAKPLLYPSMVLLDGIVQVLAGSYSHSLRQLAGHFQIGDCAV